MKDIKLDKTYKVGVYSMGWLFGIAMPFFWVIFGLLYLVRIPYEKQKNKEIKEKRFKGVTDTLNTTRQKFVYGYGFFAIVITWCFYFIPYIFTGFGLIK